MKCIQKLKAQVKINKINNINKINKLESINIKT